MSQLDIKAAETFATNFIFVESDDVPELKRDPFFQAYIESCWLVHKKMLSVVRPKYIVCLGHDKNKRTSAFSLVLEKAVNATPVLFSKETVGRYTAAFKRFEGTFDLGNGLDLTATVIGVLHPSRWKCPPGLRQFIGC